MTVSTRNVIARYREEPQNLGPFTEDKDWMTHLKEKSEKSVAPSKIVLKMMDKNKDHYKDTMKDTDQGVSVNPYDYDNANNAPKDQKDSAPFENKIPYEIDQGHYNRPKVFEKDSPLDYWKQVREEDWTDDEDQQSPAISQTRSPGAGRCAHTSKTAASLREIEGKDTHYNKAEKNQKASSIAVNPVGTLEKRKKGLYSFRVSSSSGAPKRVYFQFLRPKEGEAPQSLLEYPVQVSCNCKSFLFHGAQYYAIHDNYMYRPGIRKQERDRNIAPIPREQTSSTRFNYVNEDGKKVKSQRKNPGRGVNFRMCKHILAAYKYLSSDGKITKIKKQYKKFPELGPPTPLMNSAVWKEIFGFDFNKENIKKFLKNKNYALPGDFKVRARKTKFREWMRDVWLPRTEDEKIKVLGYLVEHPEEIFLILLRDSYYNSGNISDSLISAGFNFMDRVIQERTPKEEIKKVEEEDTSKEKGMGGVEELPSKDRLDKAEADKEEEPIDPEEKSDKKEDKKEDTKIISPKKVENRIETVKGVKSPSEIMKDGEL